LLFRRLDLTFEIARVEDVPITFGALGLDLLVFVRFDLTFEIAWVEDAPITFGAPGLFPSDAPVPIDGISTHARCFRQAANSAPALEPAAA
jgi:hypothetical protein